MASKTVSSAVGNTPPPKSMHFFLVPNNKMSILILIAVTHKIVENEPNKSVPSD